MRVFIITTLLGLMQPCFAQLDIGDTLPTAKLSIGLEMNRTIDLQTYRGKLVIIDFWSLNCISCIKAMPELDSLQQLYSDRLQIIMVTQDKRNMVEKFFATRKLLKPELPFIVEDTILSKLFPHEFVPHHIWINEQGVVTYVTGGANTNPQTINAYFKGQKLSFTRQVTGNFDVKQPIWAQDGDRILYYSTLSGFLPAYPFYYYKVIDTTGGITELKLLNAPLLTFYKMAWGGLRRTGELAKDSRIILEVKDSTMFFQTDPLKRDSLIRANVWCYEALTPPIPERAFCQMLQEELMRYFPFNVSIEKRERRVFILERISDQLPSTLKITQDAKIDSMNRKIYFHHSSATQLTKLLRRKAEREGRIFIDNSGISVIDTLILSYPMDNWTTIMRELQSFGWTLQEKNIQMDMLVIKDKPAVQASLSQ